MQTLFRGNSLSSKTMAYCFKAFGGNYLHTLLGPLIAPMYKERISFEVDPTRLDCKIVIASFPNVLLHSNLEYLTMLDYQNVQTNAQINHLCLYCTFYV